MRIPRHVRFAVALTSLTVFLLAQTADSPRAYWSCTGDHSFQSPGDTVNVMANFQGAERDDWPIWFSVSWGDGTSYYVEREQLGTAGFAVQHTYTSPGAYAFSWSAGTAYDVCATGSGGIDVP